MTSETDEGPTAARPDDERRRRGGRASPPDGWGIVTGYEDAFGAWTDVPSTIRDRLVEAMGGDPTAPGPPEGDEVLVIRVGEMPEVPDAVEILLEDGSVMPLDGVRLPADLPMGYHDLVLEGAGATRRLIVSPGVAKLPDPSITWGWAVQVYALWSEQSWGIGDLADLRELADWSPSVGAKTLLINPLDAVSPTVPRGTSPYYPTSRRFLDPIYLRIEEVPGAEHVDELPTLAARARPKRSGEMIDRDAIYAAKLAALERIWQEVPGAGREPGFTSETQDDQARHAFAVFSTIAEEYGPRWRDWPRELSHPGNAEVAAFAEEHADRVRFHTWLQWLCDEQLARAAEPIALLGDLPIGADPDGFDAWDWQDVVADGVTVGAPPDQLGPQGQNWMLPAFVPWRLRVARYEPFIALLRAAMRHVEGLRIDHVLGLFRLFWIPPGGSAAEGAYVRMPTRELLDILALESHRNGVFVVGEDLGTVEEGVRDELDARDLLRYQVWWFEEDPLPQWSPKALASVTTHDLPTVAGVWTGEDEVDLRSIGQHPDGVWHAELRQRIAEASGVDVGSPVDAAIVGLHRHVARAPDRIVVAQIDDAVASPHRINVPGTDHADRPANWSRPLPVSVTGLASHPTVVAVAAAMRDGRRERVPTPDPDVSTDPMSSARRRA